MEMFESASLFYLSFCQGSASEFAILTVFRILLVLSKSDIIAGWGDRYSFMIIILSSNNYQKDDIYTPSLHTHRQVHTPLHIHDYLIN